MTKLDHRTIPPTAVRRPQRGNTLIVIVVILAMVALTAAGVPPYEALAEIAAAATLGLRVAAQLSALTSAARRA